MRRLACLLGVAVLGASAVVITGGAPASASCPKGNGSIPTQPAKTTVIPAGPKTFYLDDRDYLDDDDEDGYAGGIWLYEESNGYGGLQRGGTQWILRDAPVTLPLVEVPVIPFPGAGPLPKRDYDLFPNGIGGGSLANNGVLGFEDDCKQKMPGSNQYYPPDTDWF